MDRIVCVVGPTASGKTRLAVELALALNGEVLSCDSMQIYRGLSIGTAAPDAAEMRGVPHHMLGFADPASGYSVSAFTDAAEPILQDILQRGRTAILCGGTGLYLDSLMTGRSFAPAPSAGRREELERMADEEGIEAVLACLATFDPESAARLHPGNRRRILRAVEIYLDTGETMTEHDRRTRSQPPRYQGVWLGLDFIQREDLYRRIERRVDQMLEAGLVEEVRALLATGVPRDATCLQAIGYKELTAYLDGRESLEQAREAIVRGTRRYAKRQRTWFRRNPAVHWILQSEPPDFSSVLAEARRVIAQFDTDL